MNLETEYAHYTYEDGVVILTFKNIHYTEAIARQVTDDGRNLTNSQNVLVLSDVRKLRKIDREAIQFFQSDECIKYTIASAVLTGSLITVILTNFFMQWTYNKKSQMPTKAFSDKQKAMEWLKQFL